MAAGRFKDEIVPGVRPAGKAVRSRHRRRRPPRESDDGGAGEAQADLRPPRRHRHRRQRLPDDRRRRRACWWPTRTAPRAEGMEVLGYVRAYACVGLDPARMGLGPVFAIDKLLRADRPVAVATCR